MDLEDCFRTTVSLGKQLLHPCVNDINDLFVFYTYKSDFCAWLSKPLLIRVERTEYTTIQNSYMNFLQHNRGRYDDQGCTRMEPAFLPSAEGLYQNALITQKRRP